jgi:hypothetical protein
MYLIGFAKDVFFRGPFTRNDLVLYKGKKIMPQGEALDRR